MTYRRNNWSSSSSLSSSDEVSELPSPTDTPVFYNPSDDSSGPWSPDSARERQTERRGGRRHSIAVPSVRAQPIAESNADPSDYGIRGRMQALPNGCDFSKTAAESNALKVRTHRNSTGSFRPPKGRQRRTSKASLYGLPDDSSAGKFVRTNSNGSEPLPTGPMRRSSRSSLYGLPDNSSVGKLVRTSSSGSEPLPNGPMRRASRSSLYGVPDNSSVGKLVRTSSSGSEPLPNGPMRRASRSSLYGLPDDSSIDKLVRTNSSGSEPLPNGPMRRASRSSLYGIPDDSSVSEKLVEVSQSGLGSRRCSISSTGSDGIPKGRQRRRSRASLYGLHDSEEIAAVAVVQKKDATDDVIEEEENRLDIKSEYKGYKQRPVSWSDNEDCFLNITHKDGRPNDKDSDYEDDLRDYRKGERFASEIVW